MTSCRQQLRVHEVLDGLSCQRCEQNAPGTRYEPWSRQVASSWHAFLTLVLSTTVRVARARIKLSGREAGRDGGLKGKQNVRHAHRKHGAHNNQASRNHAPKLSPWEFSIVPRYPSG